MRKLTRNAGGLLAAAGLALSATSGSAVLLTGGDAADIDNANVVLDIVFAIDTSGSMSDDIAAIGTAAQTVIRNLNCPNCDVWVRARFFGINGTSGSVFNENLRTYIDGRNGAASPTINNLEDNGPAVTDLANWYEWGYTPGPGAVANQKYYKAVVTIGDEGTEDGQPVNAADYAAADVANQAAIDNDVILISWVTDDPFDGVVDLFKYMAEGGVNPAFPGNVFGNTGGKLVTGGADAEQKIEEIICFTAGGGTGTPDAGGSVLLLGLGLAALGLIRRKN